MRLFISADFDHETKDKMSEVIDILKPKSKGNFTKYENLHLTLIFIGETDLKTADKIIKIMKESITKEPTNMNFTKVGRFKRGSESLVWAGGDSSKLTEIHKNLSAIFKNNGIEADLKKFVPHVTLGRRVQFKLPIQSERDADEFLQSISCRFEARIQRISLMKSDLTPAGPIYEELFSIHFDF